MDTMLRTDSDHVLAYQQQLRDDPPPLSQLDDAALRYGPLYTFHEVYKKVLCSLPRRWGRERLVAEVEIAKYRRIIPEDVLAKYAEARDTGLFTQFTVWTVESVPLQRLPVVQRDPWLVGEITGLNASDIIPLPTGSRFAVLGHWDLPHA